MDKSIVVPIFNQKEIRKTKSFWDNISYSKINKYRLKGMIGYLNKLKKDGFINDEQFTELIEQSCLIFVENELEKKVEKPLNEKLISAMYEWVKKI
ncbi:MAG: hypothetical protein GY754_25620 [bacterium]|nr:hypothetical protein [bacterium]